MRSINISFYPYVSEVLVLLLQMIKKQAESWFALYHGLGFTIYENLSFL